MNRHLRFPVRFCFFILLFLFFFLSGAQADEKQVLNTAIETVIGNLQKTGGREITLKAAEEVVNGLGDPISASGSHVKGLYTPGKSDHDFTQRVASELSPEEALASWKTARRRFSTEIKNETLRQFEGQLRAELKGAGITDPAQIDRLIKQARPQTNKMVQNRVVDGILERTNLYPPDQVIGKVAGAEEAMKKYKKIKTVPRLSEEAGKELSDNVLKKATEGLYGPGAKTYRQGYESKAGVVWEIDPKTGKARKRLIDLTHMSEGYGTYTLEGMASNSKQWGNKVKDALKEGDYRTAFKDLERLHLDMKKARDLASLPSPGSTGVGKFYDQYNEIKNAATKAFPADEAARAQYVEEAINKLFQENPALKSEIESAVNITSKEADLLRIYGGELKANRKMFIRKMLDGSSEAAGKLKSALGEFSEKYGHHINLGNFLSAIFIYLDTAEAGSRAGQDDWDGALRKGIEAAFSIPPTLLPAGVMVAITNLIIDAAKDAGYSLAVASQDCEDLLAGIISVKGWEEVKSFGEKGETSIDEIARKLPLEAQVRNLVALLARNAATDQTGTQAINKGKEESLIAKCSGQIVAKWRKRRLELLSGYLDLQNNLNEEFNNLNVELSAEPNPAKLIATTEKGSSSVEVILQVRALSSIGPINELLDQMRQQILLLGGKQKLVILTLEQKTDWFKEGDSKPFAGNKQFDRLTEILDETRLVFNSPQKVKITCQIKWELKVVSAITDSADYTTTSFEIIGPILKGELPGFKSRLIPGDVVGTFRDQLGRTYTKKAEEYVSVLAADDGDKDKPAGADTSPTSPGGPSEGKGESKDKPQPSTVITQPDSYTKGQIGIDSGNKGQTGVSPGTTEQTGVTKETKKDTGTQTDTGDTGKTDVGKPDTGKTDTGKIDTSTTSKTDTSSKSKTDTSTVSKVPECTYKYSEWGECSRATKKWTRTVIGKEPQGCEERSKPVLEGDCTPPPTEEEKRNSYLSCLCRCYTHWAGHIGVFYAPTGYSECHGSGPCVGGIGAFGDCDRSFFGAPNECAKGCYEGVYGKGSYNEKTADQIRKDVNNKFKKPIQLKVNEGKCPITAQLGDIINLTASVEGGIPPYKYSWSGKGMAKDNTFTFANSREPGPHPISVTVTDEDGGSATATCTINVEAMTVKIELLDKETKILFGESRNFKGTVMSGEKPAKGDFYFLWQPHPEIKFSPFEKTGGNLSGTKAAFNKMGKFKVWVIAHTYKGTVKTTIGESEQIEIEVSKPELKLSYQPQNPKVGQEVKLTVSEKPKMDDKAISFWWEISGNALNAGPLKNEREYTFRPKDSKPVTITVHGKAKDGGDDLGEDKATITAQEYKVSLSEPQYMGSKPKIWKCDTQLGGAQNCGLVEVTKELAVFSDIFIKATVTPEPEKPPLKYAWSVKPEGICGLPGAGQELKINCSQTGSYTASVTVRDSQNVVLGMASTPVNITISGDELEKGKKHLVTLQADKTILKTGETVNVKALVKGGKSPFTYKWSEGVEGKAESAKFTPKKSGPQKISVDVTDSAGQKSPATLDIKVEAAKLEVALKPDKPSIKLRDTVALKAEVKGGEPEFTFKWSEGLEGKGDSARFTPKKSGPQKVSLEVADGKGQKATATLDIKVEALKLEATLKADKANIKVGETADIKAEVKGGEPPFIYKWKEGVEGKEASARFTPKKSGTQKVVLEITDSAKQKATATLDIKVEALKLEATLKADKANIKVGETADIKAEVKGGESPFIYKWKEGVEGKEASARFTPKKSGTQKVVLEITDSTKQKVTANLDIKVEALKLEIALKADKTTIKVGETANIKAEVKGGEPAYAYKWSDGLEGKGDSVRFTPKKSGTQKISLEVTDAAKQKSSASLEIKIEAPKLEVALSVDKKLLKTGETAQIQAVVKGGTPPYNYSWSSQVEGKAETANFSPKTAGFYKIYVEVRDVGQKKVVGNLDVTVQAGTGDGKTSDTKTAVTKIGDTKTTSQKEAGVAAQQVIEPEILKVTPGGNGVFKAYEADKTGKKTEIPLSKVSWKIEPYRGATIDRTGKVSVDKTAKPGTSIRVTALFEKSQAEGALEIISTSLSTSSTTGIKEDMKGTKIIQPDPLQLSPGGSGLISLLEMDSQGRTAPPADSRKLSWKLEPGLKDITLKSQKDGVAVITAKSSIKAGTRVKILATLDKSQVSGTIEIIPSQSKNNVKEVKKVKEPETTTATLTESKSNKVDTASSQEGYNPLADPGFKSQTPQVDSAKIDKLKTDFQDAQWASQTKKTKASTDGSQQSAQQQPTDYTSPTKKPQDQSLPSQTQTPTQTPTNTTQTPTDTTKTPTDTTKPTTDPTKTTTSTQTATKTGLDVQVVGTAPSGKCLIVDGQLVSVKGYKENIANMTVTLTGPVNKTVTSSASGTFKFPEIPAGNYIISVKQWNYGMTKQNFVAPSGKSVKIVLKGSCPFLYIWTGEKYEKENDIFSVARLMPQELLSDEARQLANKEGLFLSPISLENIPEKLKKEKALKDYYRITRPLIPDPEGNYRLKIIEQAEEHSFTDWVQLIAVDHHKGRRIGITREGQLFVFEGLHPLPPFRRPLSLYNDQFIEVNLPSRNLQDKVLVVNWQGFQEGSPQGHTVAEDQPKLSLQRLAPDGTWQRVDWVYPRDEAQESFFLLKDLGPGWDRNGKIRLVAASCHPGKYHRLDTLSLARRIAEMPRMTFLDLLSATRSTSETVLEALQKRDGRFLLLGPEEEVSLVFKGASITEQLERSFIFVSEGFYIPMPLIQLTSN